MATGSANRLVRDEKGDCRGLESNKTGVYSGGEWGPRCRGSGSGTDQEAQAAESEACAQGYGQGWGKDTGGQKGQKAGESHRGLDRRVSKGRCLRL